MSKTLKKIRATLNWDGYYAGRSLLICGLFVDNYLNLNWDASLPEEITLSISTVEREGFTRYWISTAGYYGKTRKAALIKEFNEFYPGLGEQMFGLLGVDYPTAQTGHTIHKIWIKIQPHRKKKK